MSVIEEPPSHACIVGAGAAGGLIARLLVDAGLRVVLLEAGPWYQDPWRDFAEDELAMRKTQWPESQYTITGTAARAGASGGLGVGGGTLVWTGAAFRLLDHDFTVLSRDGPVAGASVVDWPLGYQEMAPYYDAVEEHIGVAGAVGPWEPSDRKPYPHPPHGYHLHTTVLEAGFKRLGLRPHPGPVAILSRARPGREACCSCGFCVQGCRTGAMYSTATAEIPAALATRRLDLRPNAVALRVLTSADGTSAEAVEYVDTRDGTLRRQPAEVVVVATNTLEVPRLLLNSASPAHPNGLANDSDQVGRHFMAHPGAHCQGVFDHDMNPFEGFVLNHVCCLDYADTRPGSGFIRGFVMESYTVLPGALAASLPGEFWGSRLKNFMRRYRRTAGLFTIGEGLPVAENRVTVEPDRRDRWGMPQGHLHYDWHENDLRLLAAARAKSIEVLRAAGATDVVPQPYAQVHMMGTARMGRDPSSSVADTSGRTHEVENLYVAGGALFPTGAAVNPTLTILALAWRTAEAVARHLGAPSAATETGKTS